jgi:hypothetical protein
MRAIKGRYINSEKHQRLIIGFLSIFIIIGAIALTYGGYLAIKSAQSASWPSTEGVIKSAEMKQRSGNRGSHYSAAIVYEYSVNGEKFTGEKKRIVEVGGSNASSHDAAQADLKKYAVGTKVKVFHSPADTTDAVLEPGLNAGCWFLPLFGTAFILLPSLMMVAVFFAGRKSSALSEETPAKTASRIFENQEKP